MGTAAGGVTCCVAEGHRRCDPPSERNRPLFERGGPDPPMNLRSDDFLTDKEKCRRAPPSERMGPNSPSSPVYDPMEIVRDRIDPRELQILCRLLAFRTPCQRSKTQRHPLCPAPCFPAPSANLFGGCRSIGLDFVWSDVQEALEQEGMGDSAARSLP